MSDTPRTDAVQNEADKRYRDGEWRTFSPTEGKGWAFARQLERELATAIACFENEKATSTHLEELAAHINEACRAYEDMRVENMRLRNALRDLCTAKHPLDWSPTVEIAEAFARARAALQDKP